MHQKHVDVKFIYEILQEAEELKDQIPSKQEDLIPLKDKKKIPINTIYQEAFVKHTTINNSILFIF